MVSRLSCFRCNRPTLAVAVALLVALLLHWRVTQLSQPLLSYIPKTLVTGAHNYATKDTTAFWPQFFSALTAASPRCALPRPPSLASTPRFYPWGPPTERQDLVKLDAVDEDEMRDAHAWFVTQISASSFPRPYYVSGSAGIVTAAGGKWLPECLVSLRMLRRTGSTLPVDVFLATPEEAEGHICDTVMPMLGARCHVLSELLDLAVGGLPRRMNVTHFQIKAFAILLSGYDTVFWMDADQIPLVDPRNFIEDEPFRSTGLVTWPDYWAETASPVFFRVAGIPDERIPVSGSLGASETAQLLVSKSRHLHTLELATYYNFYGPTHYYELIGQNAYGTGDKDTFSFAALVLDTPSYHVHTPLQTLGYHDEDGEWEPMAILQANPAIDEARFGDGSEHTGFDYVFPDEQFTLERVRERVPPAFLHAEQSKPNAAQVLWQWRARAPMRSYQPGEDVVQAFGFDIERTIWDEMVWTACGEELRGYKFKGWMEHWKEMMGKEEERKAELKAESKKAGTPWEADEQTEKEIDFEEMDVCGAIRALYHTLYEEGGIEAAGGV